MKKIIACVLVLVLLALSLNGCVASKKNVTSISEYKPEDANYALSIDAKNEIKDISDLLYGIFFEDINFAGDAGLYAEKVANRSFEFTSLALNDEMYAWEKVGNVNAEVVKEDLEGCLNENNTNYLTIENSGNDYAGIKNNGFMEGMAYKEEEYRFSMYAKPLDGYEGDIRVRLMSKDKCLGEGVFTELKDGWNKYELSITCSDAAKKDASLDVLITKGKVAIDMVSLFPVQTFKGRENGLRDDIASLLADMNPKFLRFPGGCVIEGTDETTAYDWKTSVGADKNGNPLEFNGKFGDVAARRQGIDLWTNLSMTDDPYPSFMTYGLGFYEFFEFSEDIGAVGVPVLNCGMYCQARGGKTVEIGSEKFDKYISDMLDLVEFCRGGENTTWGKVRCSLGHKEPFELKYICIGNENFGEDYYVRYNEFAKAFNKAKSENPKLYKDIELIYSSGVDDATSNTDYIESFKYASDKLTDEENTFAGAVDQHYYNDPAWFLKHSDYYDEENYSRDVANMTNKHGGKINVFLGEYASWSNKMYSALAESAYMTGLERNGDIVRMATYAPLLSSITAHHWTPNLIWFDNTDVTPSVNYYTQKLFSINQGSKVLDSKLEGGLIPNEEVNLKGKIGLGTWNTSASFDNLKVTNTKTGEVLVDDEFSYENIDRWIIDDEGDFKLKDGKLVQTSLENQKGDNGSIVFYDHDDFEDYTVSFEATKIDGQEGFFIPFSVNDESMFYWNVGGYGNTISCLQQKVGKVKSGQLDWSMKPFKVETGKTYNLKIEVNGQSIRCYIDDELYVDYNCDADKQYEAYQVVSTDESGDIIIKLVNVTNEAKTFAIDIANAPELNQKATVYQVAAESDNAENVFGDNNQTDMKTFDIEGISDAFNMTVPQYSATVIRISR